jgi:hypothetical protein
MHIYIITYVNTGTSDMEKLFSALSEQGLIATICENDAKSCVFLKEIRILGLEGGGYIDGNQGTKAVWSSR